MLEINMDTLPRIHGRSNDVGRHVCYVGTQDDLVGSWGVVSNLQAKGVVIVDLLGLSGDSCFSVGDRIETYSKEWTASGSPL